MAMEMSGKKYDEDKPITGTILQDFGNALNAVALVGTFGAQKYSKSNWLKVDNGIERYTDAMARHFIIETNEEYDEESGLLHAAHTAWNALARLELILRSGSSITTFEPEEVSATTIVSQHLKDAVETLNKKWDEHSQDFVYIENNKK